VNIIIKAIRFATAAHVRQRRKYSGRPYIEHPIRVAFRVAGLECFDESIILPDAISRHEVAVVSAMLHDVVEDCGVIGEEILVRFGAAVEAVVSQLSNPPANELSRFGLNRAARKALDRERMKDWGQTPRIIKLIDRIDNLSEMIGDSRTNDEAAKFLPVYKKESALLLEALAGTHAELEAELKALIEVPDA
jgi:(p)ppGpp synthase/HD superfamily hydrolase